MLVQSLSFWYAFYIKRKEKAMDQKLDEKHDCKDKELSYFIYTEIEKEDQAKKKNPEKTFATSGQVKSVGWGTIVVIILVLLLFAIKV